MYLLIFVSSVCFCCVSSFPDQGQWTKSCVQETDAIFGMHKTLYAGSTVSLSVNCDPFKATNFDITITWLLRQTSCFEEYLGPDVLSDDTLRGYFDCPITLMTFSKIRYVKSQPVITECSSRIHLEYNNTKVAFLPYGEDSAGTMQKLPPGCKQKVLKDEEENTAPSKPNASPLVKDTEKNAAAVERKKRDSEPKPEPNPGKDIKMPAKSSNSALVASDGKKEPVKENAGKSVSDSSVSKGSSQGGATETVHKEIPPPAPKTPGGTLRGSKLAVVDMDGVYLFILKIKSQGPTKAAFDLTVDVSMKGDYGYLSAVDWPLLPFYGFMCGVYVIYAFAWLFVSALQWRDLLRIQFWIGGVILLGLMEKAVFYAEYQSINSTGQSVQGAVLFAEILSCMKRTLARMLVIIVSLGFGIVKPRLGPMLHRVVGVGGLYFILGTIEGCLRVLKPKNDPSNQALMAGIPLAVTDSAICWWIFSSLVQTIRTLRLRRNVVKLSLYRHFTNTLIFAVVASVAYMIWSIHSHKLVNCITDWKELWVDEAYWHLLFSVVLLVIMILWRPTNNNQRYAFTPLLDAADDDEGDDDMDANPPNDAFAGMKMRTSKNQPSLSPKQNDAKNKQEDDLKWVEENIPSSLTDTALPSLLDSDEEIMTAKFERSKME